MNTLINFEQAKLLKEKGIIFKTDEYYSSDTKVTSVSYNEFAAPTIAEVCMWLYEKHGIWISVFSTDDVTMFSYKISCRQGHHYSPNFNSPTEAYEAVIEYTLNNLI